METTKGMRVNMNKTNVMISGEKVEGNTEGCKMAPVVEALVIIQYSVNTSCQKWLHTKCNGINGTMYEVMKTFFAKVA